MEARKYADLAMIEGHGYEPLPLDNLKEHIHEFDIIFNTIPSLILDDEILTKVKKDALIIDLASKPGGIDFDAAKSYGLKVIWALSLPGKIAPVVRSNYQRHDYEYYQRIGGVINGLGK